MQRGDGHGFARLHAAAQSWSSDGVNGGGSGGSCGAASSLLGMLLEHLDGPSAWDGGEGKVRGKRKDRTGLHAVTYCGDARLRAGCLAGAVKWGRSCSARHYGLHAALLRGGSGPCRCLQTLVGVSERHRADAGCGQRDADGPARGRIGGLSNYGPGSARRRGVVGQRQEWRKVHTAVPGCRDMFI